MSSPDSKMIQIDRFSVGDTVRWNPLTPHVKKDVGEGPFKVVEVQDIVPPVKTPELSIVSMWV